MTSRQDETEPVQICMLQDRPSLADNRERIIQSLLWLPIHERKEICADLLKEIPTSQLTPKVRRLRIKAQSPQTHHEAPTSVGRMTVSSSDAPAWILQMTTHNPELRQRILREYCCLKAKVAGIRRDLLAPA